MNRRGITQLIEYNKIKLRFSLYDDKGKFIFRNSKLVDLSKVKSRTRKGEAICRNASLETCNISNLKYSTILYCLYHKCVIEKGYDIEYLDGDVNNLSKDNLVIKNFNDYLPKGINIMNTTFKKHGKKQFVVTVYDSCENVKIHSCYSLQKALTLHKIVYANLELFEELPFDEFKAFVINTYEEELND